MNFHYKKKTYQRNINIECKPNLIFSDWKIKTAIIKKVGPSRHYFFSSF
jgi:hypothetical protein